MAVVAWCTTAAIRLLFATLFLSYSSVLDRRYWPLNFPQNFALLFTSSLLLGFLSYLFPFPTYSKLSLSPNFCRRQLSPNCTSDPSPSFTPTTLRLPFAPVTLRFPSLFLHQPQHHRPRWQWRCRRVPRSPSHQGN